MVKSIIYLVLGQFCTYKDKIITIKRLFKIPVFIVFNVAMLIIFQSNATAAIIYNSAIIITDSLSKKSIKKDSIAKDTTISPNALDEKVSYTARDSIRFDIANQKVYLFGKADVKYDDIELQAAKIILNADSGVVTAMGVKDSAGNYVGKPLFKQDDQAFTAYSIKYNFKTKKGLISDVITEENGGYIHGQKVKRLPSKKIFIKNGDYTTCDLEDPHFSIHATKLEVIPNDKIISGPAYLKVAGIPTPLVIPFGIFPNKKGQASGLLIPQYGESSSLGFYLINGGYYWTISPRMDLALTGDIYTLGSWGAKLNSNYNVRYKYNGNINLDYSQIRNSYKGFPDYSVQRQFFVRWKHNQAANARPNSRFSADVNAGTSKNFRDNFNSTSADYLTNTFTSSISYTKTFSGKPLMLSVNARHSQNSQTGAVNITLPDVVFNVSRINPFQSLGNSAKGNWFKNFGFSYTATMQNNLNTYDTLITENNFPNLLQNMQNGIEQSIPIQTSFKLFKHFTFSPHFNYTEKWYFKTIREQYDTALDAIATDTLKGFQRGNMFNAGANLSFKLYGLAYFKHGPLRAFRHVLTPSVGFSFLPENNQGMEKYYDPIQNKYIDYSIFQNSVYGAVNSTQSGFVTFNLLNNFQMKVRDRKDTANKGVKKVNLLNNLSISSAYNIFADSLNWSDIQISGNTNLLKNVSLNFAANITPYRQNINGTKINKTYWDLDHSIGRLTNANLSVNFSLHSKKAKEFNPADYADDPNVDKNKLKEIEAHPKAYVNFNIPWTLNVNYNLNYSRPNPFLSQTITHTVGLSGDINVTKKWKVGYQTNYDFVHGKFSYTSFNIYRDLHCWELTFNWVPFGQRKSYMVQLNVKSSTLQDLKLTRKREYYDINSPTFN